MGPRQLVPRLLAPFPRRPQRRYDLITDAMAKPFGGGGGRGATLRDEPELLHLFLGPLRSDLRIAERHLRPRGLNLMSCPLLALQGADDPVVSPTACARGAGRRRSSITWCPGGHFFHTDPEFLRTTLRPLVARMLAQ
jgi:surfactin synthase thioesterase subunit